MWPSSLEKKRRERERSSNTLEQRERTVEGQTNLLRGESELLANFTASIAKVTLAGKSDTQVLSFTWSNCLLLTSFCSSANFYFTGSFSLRTPQFRSISKVKVILLAFLSLSLSLSIPDIPGHFVAFAKSNCSSICLVSPAVPIDQKQKVHRLKNIGRASISNGKLLWNTF